MEGVPLSVWPTKTKLDYDHGNITYEMFSSAAAGVLNTVLLLFCFVLSFFSGTGEEKMDADKSVVFGV